MIVFGRPVPDSGTGRELLNDFLEETRAGLMDCVSVGQDGASVTVTRWHRHHQGDGEYSSTVRASVRFAASNWFLILEVEQFQPEWVGLAFEALVALHVIRPGPVWIWERNYSHHYLAEFEPSRAALGDLSGNILSPDGFDRMLGSSIKPCLGEGGLEKC